MNRKVSVIIPAYHEESCIEQTIVSYASQQYRPLEIIVVVNHSTDRTYEIAKHHADTVLNFSERIGVSAARNEGAKVATGELFIFSDADSYLETGGVGSMVRKVSNNTVGTFLGKSNRSDVRGALFFLFKNTIHRLGIYRGVIDGVIFCDRDTFFKTRGFDTSREPDELAAFIKKARKVNAHYTIVTDRYAITSLRRYEKRYIKNLLFWARWKLFSLFGWHERMKKEGENYYTSTKK